MSEAGAPHKRRKSGCDSRLEYTAIGRLESS
jgi:hypothetical protein